MTDSEGTPFPEPVRIPINGVLDLHTFHPKEIPGLLPEYLEACIENGIREVTIVHGKGKGILRETVHALLRCHPRVNRFEPDPGGNWGATRVFLADSL